ncbi:MAG TPA: 2-amino-4-hydroxy-6-hydroxymethyldihydropteridine diphosphokinase [Kiritimatiellia bacterium]|nr:2-amino-4-hydroxy-6-hydroxymethyldihydropteridine diphosphokinase [Kiritimatiellia bacterium]HMP97028.1 2-amino-4-hydroxy-6-hydroxymethyldihydropteridine diphosphokinase [Kiritimatiellia bacterium]
MSLPEIGLGLGANQGDRAANLRAAKALIGGIPGVTIVAQSRLYDTEPVGVKPEYRDLQFINAVLVITSELPLEILHTRLLAIEEEIGRRRTDDKFAPRPLDIDILFAGDRVLDTPTLKLPHPQCLKRRFVLAPLAEVRPELVLPTVRCPVRELLDNLPEKETATPLPEAW